VIEPQHIFRPSLRAFGLRCLALFLCTYVIMTFLLPLVGGFSFALFTALPFYGGIPAFVSALILSLAYMFVLDDFTDWMRHRRASWTLTHSALVYENQTEDMMPHTLPLNEIVSIKRRFFWSLVLRLSNGQAITMAYINNPAQTRTIIQNAITAATYT